MTEWQRLGAIVITQIHTDRMINAGRYCDEMIVQADRLWVGPDGVVGEVGGSAVLHGHHRLHPNKTRPNNTKNFRPNRLLSFGFTGHYDAMVERFGAAPLGCAAEDVIVERDGVVNVNELAGGLQVRRGDRVVEFEGATIAKPCIPFTKFLLRDHDAADDIVAPNRAFLEEGMRGFLVGLANHDALIDIAVGDELWAKRAVE